MRIKRTAHTKDRGTFSVYDLPETGMFLQAMAIMEIGTKVEISVWLHQCYWIRCAKGDYYFFWLSEGGYMR